MALRIGGYGYPTTFFKKARIGDQEFLVENDKFGLRFFPPHAARSPAPVKLKAHKEPGTYRIFIFGESAALGDPRPAFGAGRYLQVLLNERFPGTRFEVVCVAMTAINSHAILPIARECGRLEGDAWLIYMGNNEMVGPFGATTVLGAQAPPLWLVRLNLWVQTTRVGQLLVSASRRLKGGEPSQWTGMTLFANTRVRPDDPHNEIIYSNFRRNLEDIVRTGLGSGAHVLLNTVAVNLKDCPPFASLSRTNLDAQGQEALQRLRTGAQSALAQGNFAAARAAYQQGVDLDPRCAELQFRLGQCELALTNYPTAAAQFSLARDLDALPFRTTSRLNEITTKVADEFSARELSFFDTARFFATNSPASIPGQEWFYEHVHFNFDGNYLLAEAWAKQLERMFPAPITRSSSTNWASQELCENRLGLTDWNRVSVLEDVVRRLHQAPLNSQLNNAARLESYHQRIMALRQGINSGPALKAATSLYLGAIERAPDDFRLHENFAEFLEDRGQIQAATEQWQRFRDLLPYHHLGWFQTGRLLARQGKLAEAQAALRHSLALRPDLSEGWLELGKVLAAEGRPEQALEQYNKAERLFPQDYRVHYYTGKALAKMNRGQDAIAQYREAVKLNPEDWESVYALGEELAFAGQSAEARRHFEQVVKLKPDYAMAHLNLGVALVQQGHRDEALHEFQETLRLDPLNQNARRFLQQLQGAQGNSTAR